MSRSLRHSLLILGLLMLVGAIPGRAVTIQQQVDPPEVNVGDEVTITFTVQGGGGADINLPSIPGLQLMGNSTSTNISWVNGSLSSTVSQTFTLVPSQAGDFIIPAFNIHAQDQVVRSQPMKIHVLGNGSGNIPDPTAAPPTRGGPVVLPPANGQPPAPPDNGNPTNPGTFNVPTEEDGRPVPVFMVITPKTTDAYVGESIPVRIDFYLRRDSAAPQNSLPTMKGSDFLMNNLSLRPNEDETSVLGDDYLRETWVTAISSPKAGDFPLQMERDTYWTKPMANSFPDPFGNLFSSRSSLQHANIPSNQLNFHVQALPSEDRPANYAGAIGQFKIASASTPDTVNVGEPVKLNFTISGEGNFDYVKCPALEHDPAWKTYTPSSQINYQEESHTQAIKSFEQQVIPQKSGSLPLPPASFSYFDPGTKKYVILPVSLPVVTVTGTPRPIVVPLATTADSGSVPPPTEGGFLPNQFALGTLHRDLRPSYQQSWFWVLQAGLLLLLIGVGAVTLRQSRKNSAPAKFSLQQSTLGREEESMHAAARHGNATAFFLAARHLIQLRLGARWQVPPEALTLGEIRQRDPQLAENLEPLFRQADEIIYSGETNGDIDLTAWEQRMAQLTQPQSI